MAHFDLNEQERIDSVKYFWKSWGKYVSACMALLILAYIASSIYGWYQQQQANKAAVVYAEFSSAVTAGNSQQAIKLAQQLEVSMPGTEYTAMAALVAAKLAFDKKDYAEATKFLSWVKDKAKDKSLQSVACLRLASVYIDQKQFDKAREMLRSKHDLAFDGLFYEGRGDLYIALGDLTKARAAYTEGLQKAANDPTTGQAIQMKLDIIGG